MLMLGACDPVSWALLLAGCAVCCVVDAYAGMQLLGRFGFFAAVGRTYEDHERAQTVWNLIHFCFVDITYLVIASLLWYYEIYEFNKGRRKIWYWRLFVQGFRGVSYFCLGGTLMGDLQNKMLTWLVRGVGLLAMILACVHIILIFKWRSDAMSEGWFGIGDMMGSPADIASSWGWDWGGDEDESSDSSSSVDDSEETPLNKKKPKRKVSI